MILEDNDVCDQNTDWFYFNGQPYERNNGTRTRTDSSYNGKTVAEIRHCTSRIFICVAREPISNNEISIIKYLGWEGK
jgi:hypothetical protein